MPPVFITPKVSLRRSARRQLISQDVKLTSGVTASPSSWDGPLRTSLPGLDSITVVPDTQASELSTVPETQDDLSTVSQTSLSPSLDSLSDSPSLFPLVSEHSPADESSLLVTSAMLPPESPSVNHVRTVSALILANQRIDSLLKEIAELKASTITSTALQSLHPPVVQPKSVPSTTTKAPREMLLFRASGRFAILSNFFEHKLLVQGVVFRSAEHAYQYKKALFHGRRDISARVLRSRTPHLAKQAAKSINQSKAWQECKSKEMAKILEEKAKQCEVFRKALQNTGTKHLVHNTETDSFWGCGEDFRGLNMLGSLMEVLRQNLHLKLPEPVSPRPIPPNTGHIPTVTPRHPTDPLPSRSAAATRSNNRSVAPSVPVNCPKVLVLGNSNCRGIAQGLIDRGVDASGTAYPGGSISRLTSRIRHVKPPVTPEFVLLMAGDIEAADGLPPEAICARYEHLLREARQNFPWSRLILSGLPQTGSNRRQDTIRKVNNYLETVADEERLVEYVSNSKAKLRDNIHLSRPARERLCFNVTSVVKGFM